MRRLPVLLLATATALLSAVTAAVPAHAASGPLLPTADPFYSYANTAQGKAGVPLGRIAPGTVLASRQVPLGVNTTTLPGITLPANPPTTAEQLLYRTETETGQPSVTVTTVVEPATGAVDPHIVAYLSFYDSLAAKCDPSYTLQGGDPGSVNGEMTDVEQALVQAYSLDAVVTVPDFEGEGLDWTAGHEAGYDTLDAIRATETFLGAPATTEVGLTGYSGGSIAADWASELAATYAPTLNIVGVAEGGVPVDFAHNLVYINGDVDWASIIPAVLDTLSHVYGIDLATYLSPYGMQLTKQDQDECISEFNGTVPGLTVAKLLKPQYANFLAIPAFATVVNKLEMGTVPGAPKGPLLMAVGNDPNRAPDGEGDDIMVTKDVQALAHEYCEQGVPVQFLTFSGLPHTEAAVPFEMAAIPFLQTLFTTGAFTPESCAQIGVGNSLAPLPVVRADAVSTTTASTSKAAAAATSTAHASRPSGELAFTGADPAAAGLAALLLAAGGGALALRRRR
jgi:hypothetical protein